ncbi:MAG: OsmC family protein [Flavobacteriales bacterium]
MTTKVTYLGELRTESIHIQSNTNLISDAPTDNQGKGETFSPTDLTANALAQCMLTIMGIKAQKEHWDLIGSQAFVTKTMASAPRRISEIKIEFKMKARHLDLSQQQSLERVAKACPVAKSLHPDLKVFTHFVW